MASAWHQKQEKKRLEQLKREEETIPDEEYVKDQARAAAMGGGEDAFFEKKLSKEERKALAKVKRDTKKKQKQGGTGDEIEEEMATSTVNVQDLLLDTMEDVVTAADDGLDHEQADALAAEGTICTFSSSRKGVDARSRDINVQNFTLQHRGAVLMDETEIVLNHGNRYGLIGRNGCGKSTFMKALGARAVPIPRGIDIFFLKEEVEASDTMTALDAVMSVDEERLRLERHAEELNHILTTLAEDTSGDVDEDTGKTAEQQQEEVMEALNSVYDRLDALDANTAEVRARSILKGLGFTHDMQSKLTKDFSGGWRMRVSLARALFIQPVCLLLDEPTNHLDSTYTAM
jgi:ATP-binding cassette subfamily F protein 2